MAAEQARVIDKHHENSGIDAAEELIEIDDGE